MYKRYPAGHPAGAKEAFMKKLIPMILLTLLLLSGCRSRETYELVATTAPVCQFAQALCEGTELTVGLVVSDSVSCLHDYTLSVNQMVAVEQAETVILSGAGLEAFMEDALQSKTDRIDCSAGIDLLPSEESGLDPHIWLDPDNAAIMAANLAAGLSARYPQYAAIFSENLEALLARLSALKADGLAALSGLSCRELVTFHDGFAYFADAFDLTILAAIEEEAGSEASAHDLEAIADLIRDRSLPAVFTEKNGSASAAGILSRETGCKVGTLDLGLSGSDYFDAMNANIQAILEAMS